MSDIERILTQLTLEEKAALCTGATAWSTTTVDRLNVSELHLSDGPHGIRRIVDVDTIAPSSLAATCFPTASCLASTWDVDLLREMGKALAAEAIAQHVDVLLGPGINMKRSPLGGRNFEYFSEDPHLAGELAIGLIDGIQSKGVGTAVKHFAVNNQEFQRLTISVEVDERPLREIYLTAFEKVVTRAKPWAVMCAYNRLNGTYCSEHAGLLTDILRNEWGFDGFVVSDWGAVHDRVAALKAGLDLEMPGPQKASVAAVVDAVRSGELHEDVLNESICRILRAVTRARRTPKGGTFDIDAHHALARRVAGEGMVLLKNDGLLPLKDQQHIAVIGRAAAEPYFQGGGSSRINPTRLDAPFQALQAQAPGVEFTFAEGYPTDDVYRPDLIADAVRAARAADVAVLFIALPTTKESEGYDRADLHLTPQQADLIKAVVHAQPRTVAVLHNGAPIAVGDWIDEVPAVLEAWMMGQAGGSAVADVLYGVVNPSGKLPETFPLRLSDTPAVGNWPGEAGVVRYGEGLYIGYRYYDLKEMPVSFPFGHGLSYTTFEYRSARASTATFNDVDGVGISVDVTNTGSVFGNEVVQVYVHQRTSGYARPRKELKGFAKVALQPGETKTVSIHLDERAFAYYHPAHKQWVAEAGAYELLIGASAADIRQRVTVQLRQTRELPCLLHSESTLREWLADARGRAVLQPLYGELTARFKRVFSPDADAAGSPDLAEAMADMPLMIILHFQRAMLPKEPEDIVADLLAQVQEGGRTTKDE